LHRIAEFATSIDDAVIDPALHDETAGKREASRYLYDDVTPRRLATPPWTAYIKIAEGCDHTCAFCAIPSFRGRFRSRSPESVVAEARALAQKGVREVNLIAQDSSQFGKDLGGTVLLPELLEELNRIEQLRWIRVHYLYPNSITERLIDAMAAAERVVDYVDLPLQHAHPETLKRMRRGGSSRNHLDLLERMRRAMPQVALRSTLITGFPGETDAEFETLLAFVREARFRHLGVFTYSHEEGVPAFELQDNVPEALKAERRDRIMACQQEIVFEENQSLLGQTAEVLVEGAHAETEHLLVGRMSSQAPDVDGQVLINDGTAELGSFVQVALTEVAGYDLVGRIVDPGRRIA
jgi:ribosomal protein S12 methylthiotransferase